MINRDYEEFNSFLDSQGFTGQINEAQYNFLVSEGITPGNLMEMWDDYFEQHGYNGSFSKQSRLWGEAGFPLLAAPNPELILNGTFDTDTSNWTAHRANLSVSAGRLVLGDGGDFTRADQGFTTEIGVDYRVLADVPTASTGSKYVHACTGSVGFAYFGGSSIASGEIISGATGTVSFVFTAVGTTTWISLGGQGSVTHYFDNVSVKKDV